MSEERSPLSDSSWLTEPLRELTTRIVARPGLTLGIVLGVTLFSLLVTVVGLKFKMSRLDLLNPRSEYNQRWLHYLKEFGDQDDAVVVVQGDDPDDVLATIDELATELSKPDQPFASVMSQWDLSAFRAKALHFLSPEESRKLEANLASLKPLLASSGENPAAALKALNDRLEPIDRLPPEHARFAQEQYGRIVEGASRSLAEARPANGDDSLTTRADELEQGLAMFKSHHLLMNDGQMGFILLRLKEQSGEVSRGANAIAHLRAVLKQMEPRHPNVQIGLTGMPILEYDEMTASQTDMTRSTWLSFVCVLVFFWASFGSWRHTLLANLTLAIGMAWSFGYLTLLIGHLNILSVAFAAILIGIGIDFSIHYVSHYLNYRRHGMSSSAALIETAACVGPGVVTGAVTTALAFFTAAFTEFVGIVELGIIAGGGILLCLVATIIALPAMIELTDRNRPAGETLEILRVSDWLLPAKWFPKGTMVTAVLVTALLCWGLKELRYDHNLLNLQPGQLESVQIEREVLGSKDQSFWCALAIAEDAAHARELKKQFESLESVSRVEEVGSLLPEHEEADRQRIVRLESLLRRLPPSADQLPLPDPAAFNAELGRAQAILRKSGGQTPLLGQIATLQQHLHATAQQTSGMHQQLGSALPLLSSLGSMANPEPPCLADLPEPIRERYVGDSGKFLVRVYAKGHIWDMDALRRFVAEVESVDPNVTGHPVQTFYASRQMQRSYIQAAMYSLVCVVGTLLLDYRSIKHTALAMLPLAFGVLQMFGLMGLLGIPFNPANMIALPLILGLGVEDGVHLVHEYRRQRGRFQLGNSTAMAVMLTSATSIAGFACMIISRHQGLRSLGQILTFGMTTCMVVTLYSLPALLRWMTRNRPELAEENEDLLTPPPVAEADQIVPTPPPAEPEPVVLRPRIRPTRAVSSIALLSDDRAA